MSDISKRSKRRKTGSTPRSKTAAAATPKTKSRPKETASVEGPVVEKVDETPAVESAPAAPAKNESSASESEKTADNSSPSETAPASPKAPSQPPTRRGLSPSGVALWSAMSVAILVGTVYATAPFWLPRLEPHLPAGLRDPFQDPRMAGLGDRVRDLEARTKGVDSTGNAIRDLEDERNRFSGELKSMMDRVNSIETALSSVRRMVAATAAPNESANAEEALRELSERLARLEQIGGVVDIDKLATDNTRISAAVAAITKRVGAVEEADRNASSTASSGRAVVVAVGQLREALRRSGPYVDSLDAVKALAGEDKDMAKATAILEPAAAKGIATLTALRADFDDTASRVIEADAPESEDGLIQRTINRLSSLVRLRRTRDATGDGPAALVARTEASLTGGDLDAAVSTMAGLTGASAAAAKPWLDRARARLAAERALVTLHVLAMSRVGPAGS
jgi:hypothetical protein